MSEKKTIVVMGATGAQGGGLARAILKNGDGPFAVRAVTRNPSSDKAKALADAGAEVVLGDSDDRGSLEAAFDGAYGAFCVTNFWEHMSPERETAQAENLATAAGAAGLKHVIWSTFEDTREFVPLDDDRMPTLQQKYKVPHFDAKAEANATFSENAPTTFLYTSFYWDNFIHFGLGPRPGPDGKLAITLCLGDAKMPSIAAADIGPCAYGIFERRDEMVGKTVGIAGGHLSGSEMAASMGRALGREIHYNDVPPSVYRSFDSPGADDMGNMLQFKRDFEDAYRGARSVELSRSLYPGLRTFDQWLAVHASEIPIGE